jgi:acetyl esterase
MIDPQFQTMLDAEAKAAPPDMPPLHMLPPEMVRGVYQAQRTAQNVNSIPEGVAARDLELGSIPARLYTPADAVTPGPCLVYFHGGGWVIGDLETHDAHCRRLAAYSGARILAADYRLAPEHPFPAGHDDALAATRWAFDHAAEIGVDPSRIGIGGDSAGGNLAASVALDMRGDPDRKLKFQLLLYPATGPHEPTQTRIDRDGPILTKAAMDWFEKCLAAIGHPQQHRATPARAEDLSGLPPALVVTAGHDPLEHEGRDYAHALGVAGTPAEHRDYPDLVHDFFIMGDVSPAVVAAAKETGAAVRAGLG